MMIEKMDPDGVCQMGFTIEEILEKKEVSHDLKKLAKKIDEYFDYMEFPSKNNEQYRLDTLMEKFSGTDIQKTELRKLISEKRKNKGIKEKK